MPALEDLRAGRGGLADGDDQVLDGDRHTGEGVQLFGRPGRGRLDEYHTRLHANWLQADGVWGQWYLGDERMGRCGVCAWREHLRLKAINSQR